MKNQLPIETKIKNTLIRASSSYSNDKKKLIKKLLDKDSNQQTKWILNNIIENSLIAKKKNKPLCDDTGIPHIMLELGKGSMLDSNLINCIEKGVSQGLRELPGRPMAVKGNDVQRLEQSSGLYDEPEHVKMAPIHIKKTNRNGLRCHILMQGGGPEIRAKTFRIFHQHKLAVVIDEIVNWAIEGASLLGCTPCTPAIGIGRTHFEATSLMLEAMIKGNYNIQSDIEKEITERLNKSQIGPLGLSGFPTALATFLKIGPQRASGVRIVSLRLCCLAEPRRASCIL